MKKHGKGRLGLASLGATTVLPLPVCRPLAQDITELRKEFYVRVGSQKDQTEWLITKLREYRDPTTRKFQYFILQVRRGTP